MKNWIIVIVVIILIVAIGWWIKSDKQAEPDTETAVENTMPVPGSTVPETTVESSETVVIYGDTGFSPSSVEIRAGETVKFINQSAGKMWVASAMHPTHTAYSGSTLAQHCPDTDNNDFDQCTASDSGTSWSFTFTKTGTWKYHEHTNPSRFGTIIVK